MRGKEESWEITKVWNYQSLNKTGYGVKNNATVMN